MRVFAYESGNATVKYSWGRSRSPCCMGTEECTGEPFDRDIVEGEIRERENRGERREKKVGETKCDAK